MIDARGFWPLVAARARAAPDALCAVDERGDELSFGELCARAERVAAALAARGVGPDVRVSWQLPTWIESLVLVAALARLGAVQNPLLPIYREREIGFIARQARPGLMVVPGVFRGTDHAALAQGVLADIAREDRGAHCQLLVCDRALPEADPAALAPFAPPRGEPIRWIFYTSGTTADPKGALHTDETLAAGSRGVVERFELGPGDRYPIVFPFTHIGGIGMLVVQLLCGAGAILVEQYDEEKTPPFLGAHGVTLAAGGTPLVMRYLAYQRRHPGERVFARLRAAMGGAAPKPPLLHGEVKAELGGAGVVSVYGLTEAPFVVLSSPHDPDDALAHSEGRAAGGAELRIAGADGRDCARGEQGEIRVRGPQIFRGYLDAALDADAFDADGFFRTGDLGSLDERGFLRVTGRQKEIIIRNGENISAKEIEDLLYAHPKIADAAVIGLPDPRTGERCCAVVVPARGAALDLAEIVRHCAAAGLARQKLPERLEIVDALPRNASGKVQKHELRRSFALAEA
ncbi:MAG TPA: AMP-binding protein [Myxococcota bacterium]|nr:AMP-binding protein [Myxococcota bacterium]